MTNVSDVYGTRVFDERVMKERRPKTAYQELMRTIEDGEPLNGRVRAEDEFDALDDDDADDFLD